MKARLIHPNNKFTELGEIYFDGVGGILAPSGNIPMVSQQKNQILFDTKEDFLFYLKLFGGYEQQDLFK